MRRYVIGSLALGLGLGAGAPAQCPFEKMTSAESPTSGFQDFGHAVVVENGRIAVSWPNGGFGGRIVFFDVVGDDTVYSGEIGGGANADFFGGSDAGTDSALSMHGDRIVVGDHLDDEAGENFGAVSVFDYDGATWTLSQKILGSSEFSTWGKAAALHGDRFASYEAGVVRIFEHDGATWSETSTISRGDGSFSFGRALALEGDRLLIGEHTADIAGSNSGAVYIYEYDDTLDEWQEVTTLLPAGLTEDDRLGWDVALDGDAAIIGASEADVDGVHDAGAAFIFRKVGGAWLEESKLVPPFPDSSGRFGSSVALHGDHAVVGAWFFGSGITGAAHLFTHVDDRQWVESTLTGLVEYGNDDEFGHSVAVHDGLVVVSAPNAVEEQLFERGAVYVYRASDIELDCNGNDTLDRCDIAYGVARDCNGDGIPDSCNIAAGELDDCDGDGIADLCDYESPSYMIDDGTPEGAFSGAQLIGTGAPVDVIWLNAFTVEPGRERIGGIAMSWWYWIPPASLEWPATLLIYDDPNNDGDPSDAVLLSATEIELRQTTEGGFIEYTIAPAVNVGAPGDIFFAGAFLHEDDDVLEFFSPMVMDLTPPFAAASWMAVASAGAADLSTLTNNDLLPPTRMDACSGCTGNWLVRAMALEQPCCPGDLDADGAVAFSDLLVLLAAWGEPDDPADLDGNGAVGFGDLLILLGAWGPCA